MKSLAKNNEIKPALISFKAGFLVFDKLMMEIMKTTIYICLTVLNYLHYYIL